MGKIISMDDADRGGGVVDRSGDAAEAIYIEELLAERLNEGPLETVSLAWNERSRPRRRCVTDAGTPLALALPRGTVLWDGQLIYCSPQRSIRIKSLPEDVVVIVPVDSQQMCVIAHHLGNWHRSLQINTDGSLVVEPDAPLLSWLLENKIPFTQEARPFHPNLKGMLHELISGL